MLLLDVELTPILEGEFDMGMWVAFGWVQQVLEVCVGLQVNPDTSQKPVRMQVLDRNQKLLTPQPRLRTGFFSLIEPDKLPADNKARKEATTSAGVGTSL